jgi:hypothetical protein
MRVSTRSPAIVSLLLLVTSTSGSEPLPSGRAGAAVVQLSDGQWLVTGGLAGRGVTAAALVHAPRSGLSTPLRAGLGRARAWHSATVLPDGRVAILGGVDGAGMPVREVEVFEPGTGGFSTLGSTGPRPRARHSATLLMDGTVLIVGGVGDDGSLLAAAELWDPETNTARTLAGSLGTPRRDHRADFLADGTVLIHGGIDADGRVADDERYHPGRRAFVGAPGDHAGPSAQPPRLAASVPADGDVRVEPSVVIAVRFSRPMDPDRLGASIVFAGPGGVEPARVVVAEGGRLAFVAPEAPLAPDGRYVLSLAGAVDRDGFLMPPTAVTFTTAGRR